MEIVPIESVVGIIEIKRTLTKTSFEESIVHLKKVIQSVKLMKDDPGQYLPGPIKLDGLKSGIYSNPFRGIISLSHEKIKDQDLPFFIDKAKEIKMDLVASFDGLMITPIQDPKLFAKPIQILKTYHPESDTEYIELSSADISPMVLLSRIFGYIIAYLSNVSAKKCSLENYFFNSSLLK